MTKRGRFLAAAGLAAALASALPGGGCAVNPATGRVQPMVISEETEFRIGKQADVEIRKEYGVYLEKPELRAYVSSVGRTLAARSARPDLEYHFEIVDSPVVNAFALPGGFVYLTRGILEQMNTEDEMAAVLGHEIAHVAARHGAAQISKAYIAQAGLVALAVLGDPGGAAAYGDLANLAVSIALQGYSREYERQADEFGFEYAAGAGYNPKGSVDLLQTLERLEKREPSRAEAFFSSHPLTSERIRTAKDTVQEMRARTPEEVRRPFRRDDYLRQLDGMAVGIWNGRALVQGGRLYDKEHGLTVEVPKGLTVALGTPPAVASFQRDKEKIQAALRVEPLPKRKSARDLMAEFQKNNRRLKKLSGRARTGGPIELEEGVFSGRGEDGKPARLSLALGSHEGFGIALSVVAPEEKADDMASAFETLAGSLAPLSPSESAAIEPPRLKVRRVEPGDTWESLAAAEGDRGARLAGYNGFEPDEPPPAGRLVKIPPSLALEP